MVRVTDTSVVPLCNVSQYTVLDVFRMEYHMDSPACANSEVLQKKSRNIWFLKHRLYFTLFSPVLTAILYHHISIVHVTNKHNTQWKFWLLLKFSPFLAKILGVMEGPAILFFILFRYAMLCLFRNVILLCLLVAKTWSILGLHGVNVNWWIWQCNVRRIYNPALDKSHFEAVPQNEILSEVWFSVRPCGCLYF